MQGTVFITYTYPFHGHPFLPVKIKVHLPLNEHFYSRHTHWGYKNITSWEKSCKIITELRLSTDAKGEIVCSLDTTRNLKKKQKRTHWVTGCVTKQKMIYQEVAQLLPSAPCEHSPLAMSGMLCFFSPNQSIKRGLKVLFYTWKYSEKLFYLGETRSNQCHWDRCKRDIGPVFQINSPVPWISA